jgi:hypothetical protein
MKYYLRNIMSGISSYIEIYLSGIVLTGVLLASVGLLLKLCTLFKNISVKPDLFQEFLGYGMALIIAVEFVKMLSKHTPGSAIEVLIFALARKLIIKDNITAFDLLMGVIAIGLLFWIKKYMVQDGRDGMILSAASSLKEVNKVVGVNFHEEIAQTLGGLLFQIAQREDKKLYEGALFLIDGVKFQIKRMRDGIIEQVEVIQKKG